MRTWAHWTAKTVMLTATFAAAGAGFADTGFAASGAGGGSTFGLDSPLSGNQVSAPVSGQRLVLQPGHRGPAGGGRRAQEGGTAHPGHKALGPPGPHLTDSGPQDPTNAGNQHLVPCRGQSLPD
jgi:hypothetical protein